MHGQVFKHRFQGDYFIGSTLFDFFTSTRCIEDGIRYFSSITKQDALTCTSMISGANLAVARIAEQIQSLTRKFGFDQLNGELIYVCQVREC